MTRVSQFALLCFGLPSSLEGRLWRLDDIAGRRLRQGGRILLRASKLGFELFYVASELSDLLFELSTSWAAAQVWDRP